MAQNEGLLATGSLNAFYDEIVFWEMAKGTNRFFVTFENGKYSFQNNERESIATMEIDYPHVTHQTESNGSSLFSKANARAARRSVTYRAFLEEEEVFANDSTNFQNNGHITLTQLKGDKYYKSVLTASIYKPVTTSYEIFADSETHTSSRFVSASYFWPYSQYQLSVLRDTPSVVINLAKNEELPNGLGDKGFVLVPRDTSQRVRQNLEYYLVKAGLIEKSSDYKVPPPPEKGGGGRLQGTIAQGLDTFKSNDPTTAFYEEDDEEEQPGLSSYNNNESY
tara:strand:- start:5758 stop:6597 length:840 start_codon:yes stop_codon:yes gene_type:complete